MKERYINPFTDFGFKKIFGEELNKDLLIEIEAYEESLKGYRDLKNSFDTAREEGLEQGLEQGLKQGKTESKKQIADIMIKNGEDDQKIALYTELSISGIQELRKDAK